MLAKLVLNDVNKSFMTDKGPLPVVNGFNLTVAARQFVAIVGPSGCGKSTLMNIISGTLAPSSSWVLAAQVPIYLGLIAMAGFYLSAIVLLWQRPSWRSRLACPRSRPRPTTPRCTTRARSGRR